MAYALRFSGHEVRLPPGVVTVGRHRDCDVRIDEEGVEARHVRLHVDSEGVRIEAVEGTAHVNAKQVCDVVTLVNDDIIVIGPQRLRFVVMRSRRDRRSTVETSPAQGKVLRELVDSLSLLDDAVRAEKWSAARLQVTELATQLPPDVSIPPALEAMGRACAKIAEHTGAPEWIDWVLDIYAAQAYVPDLAILDAIAHAAPACGWRGGAALHRYLSTLATHDIDTAGRVRLRRLEALARRSER